MSTKTNVKNNQVSDEIRCINCGESNYTKFFMSKDRYHTYFKKIPYCKKCIKGIYDYYMLKYKDMQKAVYFTCRKIDVPYNNSAYSGLRSNVEKPNSNIDSDGIMGIYMKGLAFAESNGWGTCFDDSIGEREISGLSAFDDIVKVKHTSFNPDDTQNGKFEIIEYDIEELQLTKNGKI
jgi:hypothetical protein